MRHSQQLDALAAIVLQYDGPMPARDLRLQSGLTAHAFRAALAEAERDGVIVALGEGVSRRYVSGTSTIVPQEFLEDDDEDTSDRDAPTIIRPIADEIEEPPRRVRPTRTKTIDIIEHWLARRSQAARMALGPADLEDLAKQLEEM